MVDVKEMMWQHIVLFEMGGTYQTMIRIGTDVPLVGAYRFILTVVFNFLVVVE